MELFRCEVCGYVHSGDEAPEKCPKCGVDKEKFTEIEEEAADKIVRSDYTNKLQMHLFSLLEEIEAIAEEGIEDDLDPGCVKIFKRAHKDANETKRMIVAELQGHMKKGKWGVE
ncbi:rubredoxin-like domain-containing protein [Anaeromicrobium sediminis]|uniref:Rubredoxin n=1 Tax=Anaeromicrobium sediminis TaxID=1478221 RepID=A0A267MI16_9FIRM|nr:rubredoxin [Anaeromicrobium sediminis]PAB59219.1 rubredoxin [Anaeromicrobium sediminis]